MGLLTQPKKPTNLQFVGSSHQILDVLKLVNEKKGETALSDICELQKEWEQEYMCKLEKDLEKACIAIDKHMSENK